MDQKERGREGRSSDRDGEDASACFPAETHHHEDAHACPYSSSLPSLSPPFVQQETIVFASEWQERKVLFSSRPFFLFPSK